MRLSLFISALGGEKRRVPIQRGGSYENSNRQYSAVSALLILKKEWHYERFL